MDKSYLWRRHNAYWVRIRVPDRVKDLIGKSELSKNLYTTDLAEANRKKHTVIAELKERIHFAERKLDGTLGSLSKEDKLREFALEYRRSIESTTTQGEDHFEDFIENKLIELYGQKESEAIFHSHHSEWSGNDPNPKALKATLDSYRIADPSSHPISIVSKIFLEESRRDLKTSTWKRKGNHINDFIKWSGNKDIAKVSKKEAGGFVNYVISNQNPANATLSNIVSDIGSLFSWAESRGYIQQSPFYNLKLPKAKKNVQTRRPWNEEEILLFLKYEKIKVNDFSATAISLYSGMRLDEICNLRDKDISDDCFHIYEGKTDSAARVIPIQPKIAELMDHLINTSNDGFLIKGLNPGGYDSKRSWNFQKRLGRLRKQAGLHEGVVFHTLRNTFATRMENLGIPRNHISQLMGHEDSNMALDVYSGGLAIEPLRDSINKLTYGEQVDSVIRSFQQN